MSVRVRERTLYEYIGRVLSKHGCKYVTQVGVKIGKTKVNCVFERMKNHDKIQRSIDEIVLQMIGLEDWKDRLDKLYDAVGAGLELMRKLLETPRKRKPRTSARSWHRHSF